MSKAAKKKDYEIVPETTAESAKTSLKKFPVKKLAVGLGVFILLLLVAAPSVYFYHEYQSVKNPQSPVQNETSQLVSQIGKLIQLPPETPTIATVSDVTKLSGQPFFTHAQNGDKVLIYQNAKEAILYRPSENKLIQVGSINVGNTQSSGPQVAGAETYTTPTITPTPAPVSVAVYNGTPTAGLAREVGQLLTQKNQNVNVVAEIDAVNSYEKTIVVDLSGKNSQTSQSIAQQIGGQVSALPAGELKPPTAAILVIVGSDYK